MARDSQDTIIGIAHAVDDTGRLLKTADEKHGRALWHA